MEAVREALQQRLDEQALEEESEEYMVEQGTKSSSGVEEAGAEDEPACKEEAAIVQAADGSATPQVEAALALKQDQAPSGDK